jgi:outer membrane protein OmpA-like peptidoglycan-associated protein
MDEKRPLVGRPVHVEIPCPGLDPGSTVKVKVYEVHGLGGDPVESFDATVDETGGLATADWTYDHEKHKSDVTSAVFVFLAEGGGRTTLSKPLAFVQLFQATLQDADGAPAQHQFVILRADRGKDVEAVTNADGKVQVAVPPGLYHVEVKGPATPEQMALLGSPDASPGAAPDDADAQAPPAGPDTSSEAPAPASDSTPAPASAAAPASDDTSPAPPASTDYFSCHEVDGPNFEFDSSFLRPSVADSLQPLLDALDADPAREAYLFGHTDEVGDEAYNKALAERRSRSVFAFLTHDVSAWEELHDEEGWGIWGVQEMLDHLGYDPGPVRGVANATTIEAVKKFQGDQGLQVDGDAGPDTRRTLYQAYMESLHKEPIAPERFADFQFMGCSFFNPLVDTPLPEEKNRRVVAFVFSPSSKPAALPCQRGDLGPCHASLKSPPGSGQFPTFRCSVYDGLSAKCDCVNPTPPDTSPLVFSLAAPDGAVLVLVDAGQDALTVPAQGGGSGSAATFTIQPPDESKTYRMELRTQSETLGAWTLSPCAYRKAAASADGPGLNQAFARVETADAGGGSDG